MNFYQSFILEKKNFLENICKEVGFWDNYMYPLVFTLSGQGNDSKNYFKNLDYICHKSIELQKESKTFLFLVIFLPETR